MAMFKVISSESHDLCKLCSTSALGLEPLCVPCSCCGAQYHQKCMTVAFTLQSEWRIHGGVCCIVCGLEYQVQFVRGIQNFFPLPPEQAPFIPNAGTGFQPTPFKLPTAIKTPTQFQTPSPRRIWSTSSEKVSKTTSRFTITPPIIEMAEETESTAMQQCTSFVPQQPLSQIRVDWRDSDRDFPIRGKIVAEIQKVMQQAPTNTSFSSAEMQARACRVEKVLYTTASSLEEYTNKSTFQFRVTQARQFLRNGFNFPIIPPPTDSHPDCMTYFQSHP
jgi:hypothetical protein